MFLYSDTINTFIKRIKGKSRDILRHEMGITCHNSRFEWNKYLIPFHIVVFEDPVKVGFFDYRFFQIGLNKKLIFETNKTVIDNILRHEWAHFYAYLKYGNSIQDHGVQFRNLCKNFGWGEEVFSATIDLNSENKKEQDREFDHITRKIKKLMNLASGSTGPEAEAATLKANELLTKYNLESPEIDFSKSDEDVYLHRVYETKRVNIQLNSLYEILKFFQVFPVISKGKGVSFLEVIGSKHHVELADYMAKFLLSEMEHSYKNFKKKNPNLKGTVAKNSYLKGWSRGLSQKLAGQRKQFQHSKNQLVSLDKALEKKVALVYPRLSSTSSKSSSFCHQSAAQGAKDGMNTNIRKGLSNKRQNLLTY
jgi:hypothetical protein